MRALQSAGADRGARVGFWRNRRWWEEETRERVWWEREGGAPKRWKRQLHSEQTVALAGSLMTAPHLWQAPRRGTGGLLASILLAAPADLAPSSAGAEPPSAGCAAGSAGGPGPGGACVAEEVPRPS